MGFAQTNQPQRRGVLQHSGILCRNPARQQRRAGLGSNACRVIQVFPRCRYSVEHTAALPGLGARTGRCGLGHGTARRDAGKDPVAQRMGVDGSQIGLGQVQRIDLPRRNRLPQICCGRCQPIHRGTSCLIKSLAANGRMDNPAQRSDISTYGTRH